MEWEDIRDANQADHSHTQQHDSSWDLRIVVHRDILDSTLGVQLGLLDLPEEAAWDVQRVHGLALVLLLITQ